ncbi:hypothetical protein WDW89_06460 [Deltaproteobacteria bacterium TL4]
MKKLLLVFWLSLLVGCSFHYYEGQDLEEQKRWEEASIEYHLAFVDDPADVEIQAALQRTNEHVAKENMTRYHEYLAQRQYKKAYRRLEAASVQDPKLEDAQKELQHWAKVLIAGKVSFEFDRLQANVRLADEMQLQFLMNTPVGEVLTADISNESGVFFVEDILYRQPTEMLTQYSLNSIGLNLIRKTPSGFSQKTFKKFINFRGTGAEQVIGQLEKSDSDELKGVLDHRVQLLTPQSASTEPWLPPRLVPYKLSLSGAQIQVLDDEKRLEFVPSVLYVNRKQGRGFVDFGSYRLKLNTNGQWSIQRQTYQKREDDYYYQFSKNLALNPYFFYREGAYRYVLVP